MGGDRSWERRGSRGEAREEDRGEVNAMSELKKEESKGGVWVARGRCC